MFYENIVFLWLGVKWISVIDAGKQCVALRVGVGEEQGGGYNERFNLILWNISWDPGLLDALF